MYVLEVPSPLTPGQYYTSVLRPLIPMMVDCSPDVLTACDYIGNRNDPVGFIQYKDASGEWVTAYGANYAQTETSVLDVFNVTLLEGRREDFSQAGDAIISESTAKQYFPDRDPVGEIVIYSKDEYRIKGIYKDRKENESMVNGFLFHEGEEDLTLPNYGPHKAYLNTIRFVWRA